MSSGQANGDKGGGDAGASTGAGRSHRRRRFGFDSKVCVICQDPFECSRNYRGNQFACWNCRMSSEALERGFTCPITNTIMFDPVLASDGNLYERHAIQVWIATAVDNGKTPLSPVVGEPLDHLRLTPDTARLKQIEDFVVKNRLQNHPDRVRPPSEADIKERQKDISSQATQWLNEATPGKQGANGDAGATTNMAEYAALSAKRRQEEIAAGADIALAVRSARELSDLLRQLDCVRKDDTLGVAIGNAVSFLSPNTVSDCFYICRERNRIVHERNAGDQLQDVPLFRSAMRRVRRDVQVQIDIQESYKAPQVSSPAIQPQSIRRSIGATSLAPATPRTSTASSFSMASSSVSAPATKTPLSSPPSTRRPPAFLSNFMRGEKLFYKGQHKEAMEVLADFTQLVDGNVYPNRLAKAQKFIALATTRSQALKKAQESFKTGRLKDAFDCLLPLVNGNQAVLFEEDCYATVMYHMGVCCNPEQAISVLTNALKKDPRHAFALYERSQKYMKLNEYKSAKADLDSFIILTAGRNIAQDISEKVAVDIELCKMKTDPHYKRGHLKESELDQLMAQFGLED